MRFLNKKMLMILFLSLILLISAFAFVYHNSLKNDAMVVKIKNVKVFPLKKHITYKGALSSYGLSEAEMEEIWTNIDDYKKVLYIFEIQNDSWLAYSVNHQIQPRFAEGTQKLLIKSEKQLLFPQNISPGESYTTSLSAIIKVENDQTDQEILDILSKDQFTITGERVGILSVEPVGKESVTVGPFKKE
ncbi:hypothetical protein ACFO25_15870 [Paenactinomyces guangxiensis]|uniref:Uncharacterized protein n=1 Tax=Paenactinomyces guangxiensis TaxID=1490290 RepID=A0A7W1WUM9_9BACL|nr:hypothetical protein [Paenactinomyces guangxiensis]MBA4496364.1 hypothetical protein [Paenactinomyces guangxiensis]MBH8593603.1 hypothetical protein [Paenactinomyces guangxiensis]